MATFTQYLKTLLDNEGVDWSSDNPDYSVIGLDRYPIFDETYRAPLNQKIVEHYLNREIGVETPSMFKLNLGRKMREVMPYYNQLYLSEWSRLHMDDPFSTISLHQIATGTTTTQDHTASEDTRQSNASTHNTSSNSSRAVNSDFPQTALNGDGDYATSAADVNGTTLADGTSTGTENGTVTTDGTGSGTSSGDTTTTGYTGHTAELLLRYRQTFLNIDMQLINTDLDELFMQVWENGDEYSRRNGFWF